jgi:cytochrome c553
MMYRDRRLLEIVRDAPCMVCFIQDGTVVAAHSNQLRDGKGRSMKSHDFRIAAMCYRCHTRCDQGADLSKAERVEMWEEAHRATIAWLFLNGKLKVVG